MGTVQRTDRQNHDAAFRNRIQHCRGSIHTARPTMSSGMEIRSWAQREIVGVHDQHRRLSEA